VIVDASPEAGADGGAPGIGTLAHIVASRRILAAILVTMFVSGLVTGITDERQLPERPGGRCCPAS
jgi:hypothetical protein